MRYPAENGFVGMGIGAAMTGLRPIIEGMNMGFLLLAYNQISNNAGMLHYTSGGQYKVCTAGVPILSALLLASPVLVPHADLHIIVPIAASIARAAGHLCTRI